MDIVKTKKIIFAVFGAVALVSAASLITYKFTTMFSVKELPESKWMPSIFKSEDLKMEKFSSADDFKSYISRSQESTSQRQGFGRSAVFEEAFLSDGIADSMGMSDSGLENSFSPKSLSRRVSETNVQVAGIDEPDIVKTDGKKIFYSRQKYGDYYYNEMPMTDCGPMMDCISPSIKRPAEDVSEISILSALPVDKIKESGKIDKFGEILLNGNMLIIFSGKDIFGYDISDPKSPEDKWKLSLGDDSNLVQARKMGDKIYIISGTTVDRLNPCPIEPMLTRSEKISIACGDIYHPSEYVPVDSTYTVMSVDIKSGDIEDKTSIVGSSSNSVVYMSEESLYLTYNKPGDLAGLTIGFISENEDIFGKEAVERAKRISGYDISQEAKMIELNRIIDEQRYTGNDDEKLKNSNEIRNKQNAYMEKHKREIMHTGIARISVDGLDIEASGSVPGTLLNQFSMDEYENSLRIATTIENNRFGSSLGNANDVYVLGQDLKEKGSVKDMGLNERIYSARFIGDKGYLVTFRQTDPFYVLDLSDPNNPKKAGELKIPGFSSYLHPLEKNLILGIGRENSQVKLSLFDVSSPEDPKEVSKYMLDEYSSEALDNHHAFLADSEKKIFFIPGGNGGYVFSYKGDELEMEIAASEANVQRSIYIGNYLYVIGKDGITVYNEADWSKAGEFEF